MRTVWKWVWKPWNVPRPARVAVAPGRGEYSVRRRSPHGFTLVELLVVIAIIGVLVSLLLPAVQAAREAARRMHCQNNIKQIVLGVLQHNEVHKHYPTGGWGFNWLGHPDRGFGAKQPGGWIFNILPFIEQDTLRRLGGNSPTDLVEVANPQRSGTLINTFVCPTRARNGLFDPYTPRTFKLCNMSKITKLARGDYAINAGTTWQWYWGGPDSLAHGDSGGGFQSMNLQDGLSFQRSEVSLADIRDGTTHTYCIGEKYINPDWYTSAGDFGDNETLYTGDDLDLCRWTGFAVGGNNTPGVPSNETLPFVDTPGLPKSQSFGSAHSGGFNMGFCDGSVRSIAYDIDTETHWRLGHRKDGKIIDESQL